MSCYAPDFDDRIDNALRAMPAGRKAIEEFLGLRQSSTCRLVRFLYEAGWCHIGAWQRTMKGRPVAIYYAGQGKDKVCQIEPLDRRVRERLYKKRMKAESPEKWDLRQAKDRARHWRKKAKQGDPLVNALFGKAKPQQSKGGEA